MPPTKEGSGTQESRGREHEASHSPHSTAYSLVVVGTETAVFDESSSVWRRIQASLASFREVHIIVLSGRGFRYTERGNIRIYPTNSISRILRPFDAFRIARRIKRADVVTSQDPFETGLAAHFIARHFHIPLHVQVHTDFLSPAYAEHSPLNRLRVSFAGFVLRRAARVRVVSERIKRSILAAYHLHSDITALPVFADIGAFSNIPGDAALEARFASFSSRILVVSRLEAEKNIQLTLRSFSEAAPKDACLIIVGQGRERESLESLARSLDIADRVFFEGSRDPHPYYKLADVLLLTSEYEGYGLVVVEALAAGVPVLSTDVGIAREAGAIIASPETFSNALKEWLESGPRTGTLRTHPPADFGAYVRAYTEDIQSCVAGKKGHTTAL